MPSSSRRPQVVLAFACVYLCWGATYAAIRIAGEHLAPPLVGAARSILSVAVLVCICFARGTSLRVPSRTAWRLILVGILLMSVNNVLLIWGETLVPSGLSSLIIAMIPIYVAVIETILPSGERLTPRGWIGVFAGAAGMFVLMSPALRTIGSAAANRTAIAGYAILIVAGLVFAIGSILSRRFRFRVDTFVATAWQIGAAGVVNILLTLACGNLRTAHWTASGLAAIAFLSVIGSVVGLSAYTYLLQNVPVTKVATYAFVNPAIAVIIGAALFGERLAPAELAGMALILVAVATVIGSRMPLGSPPSDPLLEVPIEE
ncbi:MAG TPA: EamA family transporter [Acidobacteriaceae bacterium]|nr:EamA family transporter [Acidobacteriaceae bacterium]